MEREPDDGVVHGPASRSRGLLSAEFQHPGIGRRGRRGRRQLRGELQSSSLEHDDQQHFVTERDRRVARSGSGGNGVGPGGTPTGNPVLPQPDTEIFIGSLLILLLLLLAFAYKKARKEVDRAERRFEGKFKQPKRDGRKGM